VWYGLAYLRQCAGVVRWREAAAAAAEEKEEEGWRRVGGGGAPVEEEGGLLGVVRRRSARARGGEAEGAASGDKHGYLRAREDAA
tara:strand:- start:344 stop:598 length:255 start_codon:yes stop_codon:yes gene_type:complete